MGCGASIPEWESAHTASWPVYTIIRTPKRADYYTIAVSSPSGQHVLTVQVQLFQTQRKTVSQKALHPASVEFIVGGAAPSQPDSSDGAAHEEVPVGEASLGYIPKSRLLAGLRTYTRSVTKERDAGSYDTSWRSDAPGLAAAPTGGLLLPSQLSVVNADDRVCIFKGKGPASASEASERKEDLLARVPPSTTGAGVAVGRYQICVHPNLHASAANHSGVLQILLAIALEGFWSQGANCLGMHGAAHGHERWTQKVDNAREGPEPAVREGKNLISVMQAQNRKEARAAALERLAEQR